MDDNRQIRFLIPPFFLVVSALIGYYYHLAYDCTVASCTSTPLNQMLSTLSSLDKAIGIVLSVGFAVIPLGYIIGTIPRLILEAIFLMLNGVAHLPGLERNKIGKRYVGRFFGSHYESFISLDTLNRIWSNLRMSDAASFDAKQIMRNRFYAVAVFDHDLLQSEAEGVHKWLMRRWSSFNMSINTIVALWLPPSVFSLLNVATVWDQWKWWIIIPTSLLALNGIISWRENVKMFEFETKRFPMQHSRHSAGGGVKHTRRVPSFVS